MSVYGFFIFSVLVTLSTNDPPSIFWDEDNVRTSIALRGYPVTPTENIVFINSLSKLPFSEDIKSDAWPALLRYRNVENLQLKDWEKSLISYIPGFTLQENIISAQKIFVYFGQLKIGEYDIPNSRRERMIAMLDNFFENETEIYNLGNVLCAFSPREMKSLSDSVFRYLLEKYFFEKLTACSPEALKTLLNRVKKSSIIGPPRMWSAEKVKQAGTLVAGLDPLEIKEIHEESISELTSNVIKLVPRETLKVMTDAQLRALNKSSLLTWRRKTLDLRALYVGEASSFHVKNPLPALVPFFLSVNLKKYKP